MGVAFCPIVNATHLQASFEGMVRMEKKLLELAVEIVRIQASISKMSAEDVEQALVRVYNALHKMRAPEEQGRSILQAEPGFQASEKPVAAGSALFHSGETKLPVWNARPTPAAHGKPSTHPSPHSQGIQEEVGDFRSNGPPFSKNADKTPQPVRQETQLSRRKDTSTSTGNAKTKRHRATNSRPLDQPTAKDHSTALFEKRQRFPSVPGKPALSSADFYLISPMNN